MNKSICLAASLLALNLTPVFGQQPSSPFSQRGAAVEAARRPVTADAPPLTKFNLDLDFPGGTPKALVAAIEKAMGKPLNVIIQDEDADTKLPPVKVSDLDVAKLFKTLQENSRKYDSNHDVIKAYGFTTLDEKPSDSSLWTFSSYTKPSALTRFDLDFPGGTPAQLVKAIEKAMGKPLNAIISTEDADVQLPPLKMNDVDVSRLFRALETASVKQVRVVTGTYGNGNQSYTYQNLSYGFRTDSSISDNSVWYFHVEKPALPPVTPVEKICQFYALTPYLDRGFTVDDITTAIETGWKMAGETPTPELNYHKETKLLIAYGEAAKLETIRRVLDTLPSVKDEYWRKMNDKVRELQQQVDQLTKKISPPPPSGGTLEIK
jgi:hypothetical protein